MAETRLKSQQAFGGDGWQPADETWTYASASTFTVAGVDVTAKYPKGTKIKWTQTSVKYGVVVNSAFSTNTTVTIAVNTDYTIADAAISANFYSYQVCPQGYPQWFAFTPNYTWTNGPTTPTDVARYSVSGKTVSLWVKRTGTASGTPTTSCKFGLPVNIEGNTGLWQGAFTVWASDQNDSASFANVNTAGTVYGNELFCYFESRQVVALGVMGTYELD